MLQEMHLMDEDAEEQAFCGAMVEDVDLTSVQYHLGRRRDGSPVSPICLDCKELIVPWAEDHGAWVQDHECREVIEQLKREEEAG